MSADNALTVALNLQSAAIDARFADLEARVAKLEGEKHEQPCGGAGVINKPAEPSRVGRFYQHKYSTHHDWAGVWECISDGTHEGTFKRFGIRDLAKIEWIALTEVRPTWEPVKP